MDKKKKNVDKGFIWYGVRTLLWIVIILFLYDAFLVNNESLSIIISLIYVILSLPLFILAVIHLNIYKKEGLFDVILSLIISGISLLGFLIGLASV